LGLSFFGLSYQYKATILDEFYYFSKIFRTQYSEFMSMPTYVRKYLIGKFVEETQNQK
jgi:hypothetical protein